jgi:hypothetical protein
MSVFHELLEPFVCLFVYLGTGLHSATHGHYVTVVCL